MRAATGARRARAWRAVALATIVVAALGLRIAFRYDAVFREYVNFQEPDAWYHMRLVDHAVQNFPRRLFTDPYAGFGAPVVGVAPLFDLAVAGLALLAGAGTPSPRLVDTVGALVPPVLGALTVIPVYALGARTAGAAVGLLAAALVALLPGLFLERSMVGFTDHHVAEVALSVLLMVLIGRAAESTAWRAVGISAGAGVVLGAYLLTWTSGAFLLFVLCVFVVVADVIAHAQARPGPSLTPALGPAVVVAAAVVFAVYDTRIHRFDLHVAGLAGTLAVLLGLDLVRWIVRRTRLWPRLQPVAVLVLAVAAAAVLRVAAPEITSSILQELRRLTSPAVSRTVGEARPLLLVDGVFSTELAWQLFGTAVILGPIGFVLLVHRALGASRVALWLVPSWLAVSLAATLGQLRFGYYLVVPLAVATALVLVRVLAWGGLLRERGDGDPSVETGASPGLARAAVALVTVALLGFALNVADAVALAGRDDGLPPAWHRALTWLREATPDPFGDPRVYEAAEPARWPRPAYTVMAWWDHGYPIIRVGRRVPVSTPSQSGAPEAARFFSATSEHDALAALTVVRARYVIVDERLPFVLPTPGGGRTGDFTSMLVWSRRPRSQFVETMFRRGSDGSLRPVTFFLPEYYRSMAVHLYLYAGQAAMPSNSTRIVTYADQVGTDGTRYREIVRTQSFPTWEAASAARAQMGDGPHAIVGADPLRTCVPLDALRGIRLVHETDDADARPQGIASVRIFEVTGR